MTSYIGERFTGKVVAQYDLEQSKQRMLRSGVIYEATIEFQNPIQEQYMAQAMYQALQRLKSQYPGININYIEVNGNKMTIQFYDAPVPVAVYIVLALIIALVLAVAYAGQVIGATIKEIIMAPGEALRKLPPYLSIPLAITFAGVGIGVALMSLAVVKRAFTKKPPPSPKR